MSGKRNRVTAVVAYEADPCPTCGGRVPKGVSQPRTYCTMSCAAKAQAAAKKRLGVPPLESGPAGEILGEIVANPELNRKRLRELADACGLPKTTAEALARRLESKYLVVKEELKKVTTAELTALIDDRMWRALQYLDDLVLGASTAKELAIVVGIMAEKRQLLRGEPTAILGVEDRRHLNELGEALLKEIKRREMTIDVTPDEEPRVLD